MKKLIISVWAFIALPLFAQRDANIRIYPEQGNQQISKHIYGQFAEHLGSCIYGGLWVGPESDIPNTQGYRTDVLNALKKLQIPNLRWPGGCFADEYHWMDGIGPKENRPKMVNNNWGGTIEDNSFGTHEFLNLCELLGCEPYISGNVGSGTVEEMAKWVEYMTSEGDSPMANLRRKNGRDKAWKVKFFGVGNESWGCGGSMRPEYYSDLYRRYSTYCRNYDSNVLFKIASGASDYDYNWTETLMKQIGGRMDGISLHYYTVGDWNNKGSATDFNTEDYYWTLGKCLEIEDVVKKHIAIMDKYDPKKNIALMVDEWGTWWDVEPGTIPGHLFQQNTMRDAFVAALTLHVFHKYTDRVKMTNIAQIVNVLQSMILTKGKDMVLTPTYHVFEMYKVHQDATFLPMDLICDKEKVRDNREVPVVSASASRDSQGKIHISLANVDPRQSENIHIDLQNVTIKSVNGRILTASSINDYNTFDSPEKVKPEVFKGAKVEKGKLSVSLPPMSIDPDNLSMQLAAGDPVLIAGEGPETDTLRLNYGNTYLFKDSPDSPVEPTSPAEPLNTGVFLFKGNQASYNVEMRNIYVLSDDGSRFELKDRVTLRPFESYVVANAATQAMLKSLRLDGIVTGTELAEIPADNSFCAWAADGRLHLSADHAEKVAVYHVSGTLKCYLPLLRGETTIALPSGIYLVRQGGTAIKVVL